MSAPSRRVQSLFGLMASGTGVMARIVGCLAAGSRRVQAICIRNRLGIRDRVAGIFNRGAGSMVDCMLIGITVLITGIKQVVFETRDWAMAESTDTDIGMDMNIDMGAITDPRSAGSTSGSASDAL